MGDVRPTHLHNYCCFIKLFWLGGETFGSVHAVVQIITLSHTCFQKTQHFRWSRRCQFPPAWPLSMWSDSLQDETFMMTVPPKQVNWRKMIQERRWWEIKWRMRESWSVAPLKRIQPHLWEHAKMKNVLLFQTLSKNGIIVTTGESSGNKHVTPPTTNEHCDSNQSLAWKVCLD